MGDTSYKMTWRESASSAAQTRMNPSAPWMARERIAGNAYDPPVSRISSRTLIPLPISSSTACMSSTVGRYRGLNAAYQNWPTSDDLPTRAEPKTTTCQSRQVKSFALFQVINALTKAVGQCRHFARITFCWNYWNNYSFINIIRVATNVEISTNRGKTKIFLTNVEKNVDFGDFYGKIVEIWNRSQGKNMDFPIFANFCNERGKKRGFRGISMEKSWKFETRVK